MSDEPMDKDDAYWARIDAYVAGTLDGAAAAAMTRQCAEEAALARDVAEWRAALEGMREWAETDVPGVERADHVVLKAFEGNQPRAAATVVELKRPMGTVWRFAAAAALLLAGFGLGRMGQVEHGPQAPPANISEGITPGQQVKPVNVIEPVATPHKAEIDPPRRSIDDQGRLIVEAALRGSGGRARWIVDRNFELASNTTRQEGNGQ